MRFGKCLGGSLFFALAGLLVSPGAAAALGPESVQSARILVRVEQGLLTLEAHGAPLAEVVLAVGEAAGFQTMVGGSIDRSVDLSMDAVPIAVALERLLHDTDYVTLQASAGEDGSPRTVTHVWLLGIKGVAAGAPAATAAAAPAVVPVDASAKARSEDMLRLALEGASQEAIDTLGRAVQWDDQPLVRTRAAMALGTLGDPRAVPALEFALGDEHPSVRLQAIHALAQIPDEAATRALGNVLLYEVDSRPRILAAWALWRHDSELARAFLAEVAADENEDDQLRTAATRPPPVVGGGASWADAATGHPQFESTH